jgi:hypothetical protein
MLDLFIILILFLLKYLYQNLNNSNKRYVKIIFNNFPYEFKYYKLLYYLNQ